MPDVTLRDLFIQAVYPRVHTRTPKPLLSRRVLLIGAGGAGSWFAILYAMSANVSTSKLVVIDPDKLELVNANRLPYPLEWFMEEVPKVTAIYWYLNLVRPAFEVTAIAKKIESPEEVAKLIDKHGIDLVVDAVDNVKASDAVKQAATSKKKDFLAIHYDGYHGTIEWCPKGVCQESWVLDEEAGQGYTFPSTAVMPALLAALAVRTLILSPMYPFTHSFEI